MCPCLLKGDASATPDRQLLYEALFGQNPALMLACALAGQRILDANEAAALLFGERIYHLAYYDTVTALPNRNLFDHLFKERLARQPASQNRVAFLIVISPPLPAADLTGWIGSSPFSLPATPVPH